MAGDLDAPEETVTPPAQHTPTPTQVLQTPAVAIQQKGRSHISRYDTTCP